MKAEQLLDNEKERFDSLYRLYLEYNTHTNISAIRDKDEVYNKHFLDSLKILEHHSFAENSKILDLGAGGGFPIIPLAIVLPHLKFFALDATAKKTKFIELVKKELSLSNLEIITGRAEEFAHDDQFREEFDFVLARAVAKLNILLELSSGFIKKKGSLFAYKAYSIDDEEKASLKAQKHLSLVFSKRYLVSEGRQILLFTKIDSLTNKYPRQFAQIKTKAL
jgi:16S rRNA (guanine527-N7)-methyltransferase